MAMGKDFEKKKVLRREWTCHKKSQNKSMTMEKNWVMMTDQIDKDQEK